MGRRHQHFETAAMRDQHVFKRFVVNIVNGFGQIGNVRLSLEGSEKHQHLQTAGCSR